MSRLLSAAWWESFDARTITIEPVDVRIDPLRWYDPSSDPRTLQLFPTIVPEIERLRPNVFLHAVFRLIQDIAHCKLRVTGIGDLGQYPDGMRRELPPELMKRRLWVLNKDSSIVLQHATSGGQVVFAAARLESVPAAFASPDPNPHPEGTDAEGGIELGVTRSRTGAPGRPSAMHLIVREFERRVEAKAALPILKEEAEKLSRWLADKHAEQPSATWKTIANKIRADHLSYRNSQQLGVESRSEQA